jgi:hypothetical protein
MDMDTDTESENKRDGKRGRKEERRGEELLYLENWSGPESTMRTNRKLT